MPRQGAHGSRLAFGVVAAVWVALLRWLGGGVQDPGGHHPVEAEQPDVLGPVAPALEVGVTLRGEDAHRVDLAFGGLVPGRHQVDQVHPAASFEGLLHSGPHRRIDMRRGQHLDLGGGCGVAGSRLELARALSTAPPVPGATVSRRVRSATIRASASRAVSRSGRRR